MPQDDASPSLVLDHLAVVAGSLAEGVAHVEGALGVAMGPGGAHPLMGTHNRLLRLGDGLFLEVIAVDPAAPRPGRPRWFGLDRHEGPPRLAAFVARTDRLDAMRALLPDLVGPPQDVTRGALSWRFALPEDGAIPLAGAFPYLMQWGTGGHPTDTLPDAGCALTRLRVEHPAADRVRALLQAHLEDPRIEVREAAAPRLAAILETPAGRRVLG